jgi:hypothetical protein
VPDGQFSLTRSIIHDCPALKLPQTWLQKLGNTARIVALRGADDELAQALVDRLNAPSEQAAAPAVPAQALRVESIPLSAAQLAGLTVSRPVSIPGAAVPAQSVKDVAQQLLDGSRYAEVLTDGNYRVCTEWGADSVVVPISNWKALLAHLRSHPSTTSGE